MHKGAVEKITSISLSDRRGIRTLLSFPEIAVPELQPFDLEVDVGHENCGIEFWDFVGKLVRVKTLRIIGPYYQFSEHFIAELAGNLYKLPWGLEIELVTACSGEHQSYEKYIKILKNAKKKAHCVKFVVPVFGKKMPKVVARIE